MLYERDQLFSGTFSIVVFATRPSDTAATRNRPQNMYALKEAYASTLTYAAAPNTMPTSAKEDFQLGSARPRKRYSHALKSTEVIDLTVMKVSSGAYFMTSMPAYRSAKSDDERRVDSAILHVREAPPPPCRCSAQGGASTSWR